MCPRDPITVPLTPPPATSECSPRTRGRDHNAQTKDLEQRTEWQAVQAVFRRLVLVTMTMLLIAFINIDGFFSAPFFFIDLI